MNKVLSRNVFFIKEHLGIFKAANNFDVFDPETNEMILTCREEKLGFFTKMLRFSEYKRMTPFHLEIKDKNGDLVLSIKQGVSLFLSKVQVFNEKDELIGWFKQKISIGGKFEVLDKDENPLCLLKGDWTSWSFTFSKKDVVLANVNKEWAGFSKEMFTSADNYMLRINEKVPADNPIRLLIMAAAFCIDLVLKE